MTDASDRFQYQLLEADHIRVLHALPESSPDLLRFRIEHRKRRVADQFTALSYCWGNSTCVADIMLDERPFGVAENLYAFLRQHTGAHCLWIDAICINQDDDKEKSEQVQNMWQVYSSAQQVLAWLGPEKEYTAEAFQLLNSLPYFDTTSPEYLPDTDNLPPSGMAAINALSFNPYFSRMWIFQEIALATNPVVLASGQHSTFLNKLDQFNMSTSIGKIGSEYVDHYKEFNSQFTVLAQHVRLARSSQDHQVRSGQKFPWYVVDSIFEQNSARLCFDPRDRLFALLGLQPIRACNEHEILKVDYSMTMDEVAVMLLSWIDWLNRVRKNSLPPADCPILVSIALKHDCDTGQFKSWLREAVQMDGNSGKTVMRTASGTTIDCSGPALQYLLSSSTN